MNRTKIEYLDYTWNPICMRCGRVSEGCANCWHLRRCGMLANNPVIKKEERAVYKGGKFLLRSEELDAPQRVKKPFGSAQGRPARIGVQFMGDLFHEDVKDGWIIKIFEAMHPDILSPSQHTFLILTKRPKRMADFFAKYTKQGTLPWKNVWLGVTVENQTRADERIPILLSIPAAKHFVSVEPMLDPVHLDKWLLPEADLIDWVIAGPETPLRQGTSAGQAGTGARACLCYWMGDLLSECREAGIPFFDKREDYLERKMP